MSLALHLPSIAAEFAEGDFDFFAFGEIERLGRMKRALCVTRCDLPNFEFRLFPGPWFRPGLHSPAHPLRGSVRAGRARWKNTPARRPVCALVRAAGAAARFSPCSDPASGGRAVRNRCARAISRCCARGRSRARQSDRNIPPRCWFSRRYISRAISGPCHRRGERRRRRRPGRGCCARRRPHWRCMCRRDARVLRTAWRDAPLHRAVLGESVWRGVSQAGYSLGVCSGSAGAAAALAVAGAASSRK